MDLAQKLIDKGVICNIEDTSQDDVPDRGVALSTSEPYPNVSVYSTSLTLSKEGQLNLYSKGRANTMSSIVGSFVSGRGYESDTEMDTDVDETHHKKSMSQLRDNDSSDQDSSSASGIFLNFNNSAFSSYEKSAFIGDGEMLHDAQHTLEQNNQASSKVFGEMIGNISKATLNSGPPSSQASPSLGAPMLFHNDTKHFYHFTSILDQLEDENISDDDSSRANTPHSSVHHQFKKALDIYIERNVTPSFILAILKTRFHRDLQAHQFILSVDKERTEGFKFIDSDQPFVGHLTFP